MATKEPAAHKINTTARKAFGFESLRPGQEEAVRAVLDKRDTLVVQPTGSGKSAIYQISGLLIEGTTVVVSPLIALQKDQVDSINSQDAAEAVVVNSTQKVSETRDTFERIEGGKVEYVFLAPEQLRKQETIDRLQRSGVSLFVVDEAHCISEWGHSFRPDYLLLGSVIERLGHPTVLAMTATASPQVREEIVERLGMRNARVYVHGFDRPNIHLRVDRFSTEEDKLNALLRRVGFADKPGIVYCATRKNAEEIMRALQEQNVPALFYHGGLKAKEREAIHNQFMGGDVDVMVATNAFGMGIDKADVRFVYHFDVSDSLDSYYQEIGRGGRDGEKAEAVLFFRPENIGVQKFRSGEGKLETGQIEQVASLIAAGDGVSPDEIRAKTGLSQRKLATVLHRLEDTGALEVLPGGELQLHPEAGIPSIANAAAEEQERHRATKRKRLQQMEEYADSGACRRELLMRYFGDMDFKGPCGNCDNCTSPAQRTGGAGTRREVV